MGAKKDKKQEKKATGKAGAGKASSSRKKEAKPTSEKAGERLDPTKWTGLVIRQAIQMAKRVEANAILFYMDSTKDLDPFSKITSDARLILLTKRKDCIEKARKLSITTVMLPDVQLTRIGYLKIGFLTAISKGLVKSGDVIVCVGGVPNQGYMDTIMLVEAGLESELFGGGGEMAFPSGIKPDVFETLLDLVVELANEGREGKPVGSIFVLGNHKKVLELSYQLVFNPFQGHPEDSLNLHNREVQETLKEFSSIDGAFVIREDGVLLAAGRYLNIGYQGEPLPQGLGARHAAAAAITQATDSIALVISESTGKVTIFRGGRILSEIEKAATHASGRRVLALE
ncbi:MAG: diadenylate cyclase [Thermodesulfobacteriota bacterium]